ncbi:PREDICTED: cytosolic sulfotransferase 5-like [Tarenaya hassleriana]|uniref:cytosolic sulfotransferase 5-like n=1 Tax=Tarenaya hassleriana TaxID=28532 RepID=UPI00053C9A2B|nr:PREDICTED: cytosolic sulfotransferase 5-like [Tarenaya hassleriana]
MEVPEFLRDDKLSEESKNLISRLAKDKNFQGTDICNYKGCWYFFNALQGILHAQTHFHPQDSDVFLSSFPKSGTTWLKALVFALIHRHNHHHHHHHPLLARNPHDLVPFLELRLYFKNQIPDLSGFPSPRLFATHMPFPMLRETIKGSPSKIVYICRDPKDTLVSAWHFYGKLQRQEIRLETVFDSYCRGVHAWGPFWDHVLSYWKESVKNPKHVFFMRYEELQADPTVQLKRLAGFLECPFTEEEEKSGAVDQILKLCSFSSLSGLEVNKTGKTPSDIDFKTLFRKGEVGDWANYLTPEMGKRIDDIVEDKLRGSGLTFL